MHVDLIPVHFTCYPKHQEPSLQISSTSENWCTLYRAFQRNMWIRERIKSWVDGNAWNVHFFEFFMQGGPILPIYPFRCSRHWNAVATFAPPGPSISVSFLWVRIWTLTATWRIIPILYCPELKLAQVPYILAHKSNKLSLSYVSISFKNSIFADKLMKLITDCYISERKWRPSSPKQRAQSMLGNQRNILF